jgi:hypothetical protein
MKNMIRAMAFLGVPSILCIIMYRYYPQMPLDANLIMFFAPWFLCELMEIRDLLVKISKKDKDESEKKNGTAPILHG